MLCLARFARGGQSQFALHVGGENLIHRVGRFDQVRFSRAIFSAK